MQYGSISTTDQVMEHLASHTNVNVIDFKPLFSDLRDKYELYSPYGDPVHWSPRGSFVAYTQMMETINSACKSNFRILSEDDFDITTTDQGWYFYGGLSLTNYSEAFTLKNTDAEEFDSVSGYYSAPADNTLLYYRNSSADNDKKVLIFGNSFLHHYNISYFGESFSEVLFIRGNIAGGFDRKFEEWVDEFNPDIVVSEIAERYAHYDLIKDFASTLP